MATKNIRLQIQTGFVGSSYEYEEEIEYDGTQEDLEIQIDNFYRKCLEEIVQDDFEYSWEEI